MCFLFIFIFFFEKAKTSASYIVNTMATDFIWNQGINSSLIARFMGANMGPIWGRQDPSGPHVGPMNIAVWVILTKFMAIILVDISTATHPPPHPYL